MQSYKVTLKFTNLDNSLYTTAQASMVMDIQADDYGHAYLMAERLKKTFDADEYEITS
jgi:hypothetical protein